MHGYTGVTSALTPIVLLLGSYVDSEVNIIYRVANTIIAIIIYLFIDMFILPTRTDTTVRTLVVRLMRDTTDAFANAVDAVQPLLSYCNNTMGSTPLVGSLKDCSSAFSNVDACVSPVAGANNTNTIAPSNSSSPILGEISRSNNKFVNNTDEISNKPSFGIDGNEARISVTNLVKEEGEEEGLHQTLTGADAVENVSFNQGLASEIAVCDRALELYEVAIRSMIKRQKGLTAVLLLGMHEPDIFSR